MNVDLSRPDIVFALTWGATLALFQIDSGSEYFGGRLRADLGFFVVSHILSFFVLYRIQERRQPRVPSTPPTFPSEDLDILARFNLSCFRWWLAGYAVSIVASGGLPIIWVLTGDERTYRDFGVPTLSGLLNMVRAFLFAGGIFLYLQRNRARDLLLPLAGLLTSLFETSRGNLTVMLLHGVGMYVFLRRISLRTLLTLSILTTAFVLVFGFIADFREGGRETRLSDFIADDAHFFYRIPNGAFWGYVYAVSPLTNLNYAIGQGIEPSYIPNYSVQPLLPTVIRSLIFPDALYPVELINPAFNATTFYSPLIADFGLGISWVIIVLIQLVVCQCHVQARRGSLRHTLIYPVLYMCILNSGFYMFFFSMVTVLYPSLVGIFMRNRQRELSAD